MIDWSALSLTFKTGPRSALPSLALARACSTAALHHEDIISDLPPVFDSIPELCKSSGPSIPTRMVPISKSTSSVKLGPFSSNSSHLINTPSGQVVDASSHTVNSPPCQVGVIPCNPGGIEPSTLVNSLPGQVRAMPLHPINTLLGPR